MRRCNITGKTDEIFEFYFTSEDYGYFANKLTHKIFTFYLHIDEFEKFMKLGADHVIGTKENFDNHAYKYNKYFSSDIVYDFIHTFKYVPHNWYRQHYPFLEHDEEQWLWEDQTRSVNDLIEQLPDDDRKQAIKEVMYYYGI